MTSALTTAFDSDLVSPDGLCLASPDIEVKTIGLDHETGQLYFYGDTRQSRQPLPEGVSGIFGAIVNVAVTQHGNAGGRGGNTWEANRDHLTLRLQSPNPLLHYVLRLPAHNGQWHYRSLLGALLTLDLQASAVKLEAKRGREATFFQVSLDHAGLDLVRSQCIGPDAADLRIAVDRLRRSLGLPPQTDECLTPPSQTPSPVINCEAS
jgi:hypothetical protein